MARSKSAAKLEAKKLKKEAMRRALKQKHRVGFEGEKAPRKKPRWKWRTVANRQIREQVRRSGKGKAAIPRAAMERLVRQFAPGYQFEKDAIKALIEVAEAHAVDALEAANIIAIAEKVPTVQRRHMQTVALVTNKLPTPTPLPDVIDDAMMRGPPTRQAPPPAPRYPKPTKARAQQAAPLVEEEEGDDQEEDGDFNVEEDE